MCWWADGGSSSREARWLQEGQGDGLGGEGCTWLREGDSCDSWKIVILDPDLEGPCLSRISPLEVCVRVGVAVRHMDQVEVMTGSEREGQR